MIDVSYGSEYVEGNLRVRVEYDQECSINDFDCYGKISQYFSHWDHKAYGRSGQRPDGFTGRAMKLDVDRSGFVWWEPYEELTQEQAKAERSSMQDLVESGFYTIFWERLDGVDGYGRPIVVEYDCLCGCEPRGINETAEENAPEWAAAARLEQEQEAA